MSTTTSAAATSGAGTLQMATMQARSGADLNNAKIAIRALDFYYGANKALKGINLDFPDRQVTGMIGPSGCGKSTLLRVLNRMYDLYPGQHAEGEVLLEGTNILASGIDINQLRSRVGMVFQKPTPFPMSIYENITFGVKLHERLQNPRWTRGWSGPSPGRRCGARSRIG